MTCEIDEFIGFQIKSLRLDAGVSMMDLGRRVGVIYQQIQKYENGTDRVSASRLYMIANALGVPVSVFFPDGNRELSAFKGYTI